MTPFNPAPLCVCVCVFLIETVQSELRPLDGVSARTVNILSAGKREPRTNLRELDHDHVVTGSENGEKTSKVRSSL